ncbi:hypothetical protein CHS0354_027545 [Potamilus streckersoni]|uniref:Uncharacterized protein n=1 Tax=Potamilus streckersoni TaxID=2493646 RepID=A0AAE0VMJ2_9BIVA|nr:hypothetical protein CHS0354_027545 [Potamilus streckersoni]
MVEAVMYLYMLYLLNLWTQMTSSMMLSGSESRFENNVCQKIPDFVCSIDIDSVSLDDMNSLNIPCPPPYQFIQFCDTNVGHILTCKLKLNIMRYCYEKYSHMYPANICVNCSCDDNCKDVRAFMIQKRFLVNTSYPAYSSTTSRSRSSTFSASVTDFSKITDLTFFERFSTTSHVDSLSVISISVDSSGSTQKDILLPSINSTSNDSNSTYIDVTTLETKTQFTDSQQIELEYRIILLAIFIIEAMVLIIIFRYRRKYRQSHISSNQQEENAASEMYRVSSTMSLSSLKKEEKQTRFPLRGLLQTFLAQCAV